MGTEDLSIQFNPQQALVLNFILAYIMFAVSLEMEWKHFKVVFSGLKSLYLGVLAQILLLPLMTLGLIWIMKPGFGFASGMLLLSVCPGGNVSNYAVYLAKGNTALSVVLTSVSTLFAAIHVPVTFLFLLAFLPVDFKADQPEIHLTFFQMAQTVGLLMIVPVIAGLVLRKVNSGLVEKILPFVKLSSLILFLMIIATALYSNWEKIPVYVGLVFVFVFIHNTLALVLGFVVAHLGKLPFADKKAITLETGIQNSGLALVISLQYFPQVPEMALMAAWWSIWHLLSAFSVSMWWKFQSSSSTIFRKSASE